MEIEFWYEFASTYSYLAAERAGDTIAEAGHTMVLRPFLLGPIFASQGWNDSPFNLYPAKGRYMWHDLQRLCHVRGLPFQRPESFPKNGLHAARIAFAGQDQPWGYGFTRAVYRANFRDDLDISDPKVLAGLLKELGQDPDAVIACSKEAEMKNGLRAQTEHAVALGIFGAPTFVVGDELFWGDDRLDLAVEIASQHSVK